MAARSTPKSFSARVDAWRDVLAQAAGNEGGRFTFPPDRALAARLADLATAETQCCGHFRFDLAISAAELTLRIGASSPR